MLEGKPTIVLSYSERYVDDVVKPIARGLAPHGFRAILVGEEPLPAGVNSNPNDKVEWYFRHSDMAVFLATPDDRLETGEVHTRPNIIDEHRLGQQLDHLRHKLLVFKDPEVTLPSNINPVYERLPQDDLAWVVSRIVDQARAWGVLPAGSLPEGDQSPQESEEGSSTTVVTANEDADASEQAAEALRAAMQALRGAGADDPALRRAELAVAGLISDGGSADTLGVHLTNRIFTQRHELRLRPSERLLLLRTYLQHGRDENVPGIVWLKDLGRANVTDLLTQLAEDDSDEAVQAQALTILGKLGAPKSSDEARRLLLPFVKSAEFRLRWAAVDYLYDRRDRRLRDLLDDPSLLENDRHRTSQTAALLDLPRSPGAVLDRYIEDAYVRDKRVERALLAASSRISRGSVHRAIRSSVRDVCRLGLQLAAAKRCLSPMTATELIATEKSPRVRLDIVRALMAADHPVGFDLLDRATKKRDDDVTEFPGFDEARAVEVELGLRMPLDELAAAIKWSGARGASLYEALGRRSRKWADKNVRRDLENDFKRLKDDWRVELTEALTAATEAKIGRPLSSQERDQVGRAADEKWYDWTAEDKLGNFLLRQFRLAALRIIGAHGRPTDVRFARRFAKDGDQDIRAEALRLFEEYGTPYDATVVLGLVEQVYSDDDTHRAAETALRLAYKKNKLETLAELRKNHTVRVWAVTRLADVPGGFRVALALLRDDDPDVRLAAADVVWSSVKPEWSDRLLSEYMRHRHFYNVVRAIDKRLYAPDWLRRALTPAD